MMEDQANIDFVELEPRMAPVTCLMIGRLLVTFHGSQSKVPKSNKPPAHVC